MNQDIDLKELERKAFTSYFQDGLWDICIAMMLLAIAISLTLSNLGTSDSLRISLYVPVMLSGSLIIGLGKKFITSPRIGFVKFGRERMKKIVKLHMLIVTAVIMTVILVLLVLDWIGMEKAGWVGDYAGDLIFAALIIIIFSGMAYFFDFERMHYYGILLTLANFNWIYLDMNTDIPPGVPVFLVSLIVLGFGIRVLMKFMEDFPLPREEAGEIDG